MEKKFKSILATLEEPKLTDTAKTVLEKRYLKKDENGKVIETPKEMFWRVAWHVAGAKYLKDGQYCSEKDKQSHLDLSKKYYTLMASLDFLPNTPTLINAGRGNGSLSACYVLAIEDTMESIFNTLRDSALIFKHGGGVGYSFSNIRPEGNAVGENLGVSSGPISFMKVFNAATEEIKQGGVRRGAMMGILSVHHPDILKFITCKDDNKSLTNFNISVAVTDNFMKALKIDGEYELIDPKTNQVVKKLKAKHVFDLICKQAHKNGEPGVLFIDTANKSNVLSKIGKFEATNPCVTGDTLILTDRGEVRIDSVVGQKVRVWNGYQFSEVEPRITAYNQDILDIEFSNGSKLSCTPYHRFIVDRPISLRLTLSEDIVQASDLLKGYVISTFKLPDSSIVENVTVVSITPRLTKEPKVYCFYEPFEGNGCFNGILTKNCAEQWLLSGESCNLGSINLSNFVKDGTIDFDRLGSVVDLAVTFLDNVIDVNNFPLPEIAKISRANRKIGLGVMGFADALVKLNIPYNSKEGLDLGHTIMESIQVQAMETSFDLAVVDGAFPNFEHSTLNLPRRNAALTCVAPTGTISMLSDCSSGIEPLFGVSFTKTVMDGKKFKFVHPELKARLEKIGVYSDKLEKKILDSGTIKNIEEIPESIKKVFVTAHDISPEYHIKMQAVFQKYVDSSLSKTINFPKEATVEDVAKGYLMAYELGCKGATVYRDGSREGQVLTLGTKAEEKKIAHVEEKSIPIRTRKRPAVTRGETHEVNIGCGTLYVTVNEDDKGVCEVFISVGKSGGCVTSQCESIGRLISLATRSGVQLDKVIKQMKGIRCPSPSMGVGGSILSCSDGISKVLEGYLKSKKKNANANVEMVSKADIGHNPTCPDCGEVLMFKEGCVSCNCGWSKCS